jgi:hypothetical protein
MSESSGNFKPGTLAVRWRKNPDGIGPDLVFYYPTSPVDGHLLNDFFNYAKYGSDLSLVEELKRRGYDIKTLQFTIRKLEQ